jgi:hypothetical protein
MKKNRTPVVLLSLAGIAAAFLYFRNKKAAGENLRFEPVDIAIDTARSKSSLWTRLFYRVKIKLVNVEPASVNVKNVNLTATANGKNLGSLTSSQSFVVPPKGSQVVALDTSISTLGAASTIIQVIRNRQPLTINISGYIDTDLGRVVINYDQNFG